MGNILSNGTLGIVKVPVTDKDGEIRKDETDNTSYWYLRSRRPFFESCWDNSGRWGIGHCFVDAHWGFLANK